MKRLLSLGSILLVLLSVVICFYLFRAVETASASANPAFVAFPINQPRLINFDVNSEALADRSPRERLDQTRDWLLYAVLSESGKSVKELGEMLYDLPATRTGYMHQVGNFEYGEIRSRFIGDGQVVALVPAGNSKERLDQLAHVADEHRKNTGAAPSSILVFDYQLNADENRNISSGEITRRETIDGKTLFTPEYGYYESQIKSLDELKQFMQQVDDLVFAKVDGETLKLGGRKLLGRAYRGISVEDVAAIWQSESKLTGAREGSGFSLDPGYRFDKVKQFFNGTLVPLFDPFTDFGADSYGFVRPEEVRKGLDDCDIEPLFRWIEEQRTIYPEATGLRTLEPYIAQKYGLQKARYDGDLQGTEVGMILFYTDLVAKLWDFDYQQSIPREIQDFKSELELHRTTISPVFKEELEKTPWARLWFGPDTRGYASIENGKSLVFARRATKIFAKSSSTVGSKNEVEADVGIASFINWWDDHYEEVAQYEPEYERLNQIMKWSLVITWLNNASQGSRLGFLDNSSMVNRSYRFPEWVKQQPNLRFNKWSDKMFLPADTKCVSTEALPLLESVKFASVGEQDAKWQLSGGVSLSNKALFGERTFLSAESKVASLAQRSGINYSPIRSTESALEMVEGASYKFQSLAPNRVSVKSIPKPEAALRTNYGRLATGDFQSVLATERTGLSVATKYGETAIGNLSVSRTGNAITIGWRGRELDLGQTLARKLSTSTTPEKLLATDSSIESAISLGNGKGYLIKLSGSEKWTRVMVEKSAGPIDETWTATFGGLDASTKPVKLAWVDDAGVGAELGEGYVAVSTEGAQSGSSLLKILDNAPPPSGKPITLLNGEQRINAVFDPGSKSVLVRYRDLPETFQKNPGGLQRAVARSDVALMQREGVLRLTEATSYESALTRDFVNRDYAGLSKQLTESPSKFKAALESNLREGLQQSDALLASKSFGSVEEQLDILIKIYGERPELVMRRGVAQIRSGQMQSAAIALSEHLAPLQPGPRQLFFNEINLRLRTSSGPGDPIIELVDAGGALGSRVKIPNLQGSKVSAADIDSGTFYIQDSGHLRNLDWQSNFQGSLNEVISGEFADVIKLPPGGPGNYRPTEIYVGDTGMMLSAARKTTTRYNLNVPVRVMMRAPCQDDQNDRDERNRENRCSDIYLVVDRRN
ncbi:MAG TPA: hypothetical protein VFS76_04600 [Pyrinomonadaceae bacterium]|nr:hypothetical protein [Pyrinomonadaceae bacterium]